ncbi:hypothetical protein [Bradyrhizobium sp. 23]|uniref:hypothetical protein n=1 Tax=Bradyrhizobium sp. 23 TaxID=2782667 RepID=UPI001FF84F73|nr:hypothetical protein [Bradyrhizobium sp. 23]MCK1315507.1 hypothetical protein [Bradyrhizobium sp. 23]
MFNVRFFGHTSGLHAGFISAPLGSAFSKVFPELGQEEQLATIRQMEANMDMDAEQGARIRETLGELGRGLAVHATVIRTPA